MNSPSERLSLPKDRIKVLLLEGINDSAANLMVQAGYGNMVSAAQGARP
jgi:D-3-phosphoglycerate dehydrogenase